MLIINITFRGFYPHSKNSLFCALFWSNCAMLNCAIMNGYITSFLFAFTGPQQPLYQDERLIGDHRRPSVKLSYLYINSGNCVQEPWYKASYYHVVTSRGGTSRRDQRTWPPKSEGKYKDSQAASIRIPQEVNQTERLTALSHPLHSESELLPSGRRYRLPMANRNIHKKSFIPGAVTIINEMHVKI